jgi:hypothetical protein
MMFRRFYRLNGRTLDQKKLIAAAATLFAIAAGVALVVTAMYSTRAVSLSARVYTDWNECNGRILMRVNAYDSAQRSPVKVRSVTLAGKGIKRIAPGLPDGSTVIEVTAASFEGNGAITLSIETEKGSKRLVIEGPGSGHPHTPVPRLKPVSAELRTGPSTQLGLGTQGSREEIYNREALDQLKIIPYPEQGRLAANLPNRVFLWGRGCPGKSVEVESGAGRGAVKLDEAGIGELLFTPTFGASWLKLACGVWSGRADLRDRPQGITVTPAYFAAHPGDRINFRLKTLFPGRPLALDIFRGCGWIESRNIIPGSGETGIDYTLPAETGVYSMEIYGNSNVPGDERARVLILSGTDARAALDALVKKSSGRADEPVAGLLMSLLEKPGIGAGSDTNLAASAFVSRLVLDCGPPPVFMDTIDSDLAALTESREGMKTLSFGSLYVICGIVLCLVFLIMFARIVMAARTDKEDRIEGHSKHVVAQHLIAALLLAITFAILLYAMHIWWGG